MASPQKSCHRSFTERARLTHLKTAKFTHQIAARHRLLHLEAGRIYKVHLCVAWPRRSLSSSLKIGTAVFRTSNSNVVPIDRELAILGVDSTTQAQAAAASSCAKGCSGQGATAASLSGDRGSRHPNKRPTTNLLTYYHHRQRHHLPPPPPPPPPPPHPYRHTHHHHLPPPTFPSTSPATTASCERRRSPGAASCRKPAAQATTRRRRPSTSSSSTSASAARSRSGCSSTPASPTPRAS